MPSSSYLTVRLILVKNSLIISDCEVSFMEEGSIVLGMLQRGGDEDCLSST